MGTIDWVKLWLLNRTLYMECRTSLLVHRVHEEHFEWWAFPGQPATRVSADVRMEALRECVQSGLIRIYSKSWMEDCNFYQGDLALQRSEPPEFLRSFQTGLLGRLVPGL